MIRLVTVLIEKLFAYLIIAAAALGIFFPEIFLWLKPHIPLLLGFVMFGIGLTIQTSQLKAALRPSVVLLALGKFFTISTSAYMIGFLLQLPQETLIGMVILGACPGGVAANVMSYIARANTALTVMLTILTTILSPLLTPLMIYIFLHQSIAMDVRAMMGKLFWVVLFPLFDAMILRRFFVRLVEKIQWGFPSISMIMVAVIVAFVTAANRTTLLQHPWLVVTAVMLLNISGYAIGYLIAKLFRYERKTRESVAFEYGMQDSALGIIVATSFFTSLAALPSAIYSVVQNLTGPWLARWFRRWDEA